MDQELVAILAIPILIGSGLGFAFGYLKALVPSLFLHGFLLLSLIFCAAMMSQATGWDGIVWLLGIIILIAGWIPMGLLQLVGYLIRRLNGA